MIANYKDGEEKIIDFARTRQSIGNDRVTGYLSFFSLFCIFLLPFLPLFYLYFLMAVVSR